MENINKNAYYRFLHGGETCLGVFSQSLDDPKSDRVQLLEEVSVDEDMNAAGSFYVSGMKKVALTDVIILADKNISKEDVFVVHKHWLVKGKFGPFIEGMEDLYYTESLDKLAFPPGNFAACLERFGRDRLRNRKFSEFIDTMNNINIHRFRLYASFQQSLRTSGNATISSFNVDYVSIDFILYLDKSLGEFGCLQKDKVRVISIQEENAMVRRGIPSECIVLQSPNVDALIKYFGSNFYYCPLVGAANDIGFDNEIYAFIPVHNAQIFFEWDSISHRLHVSFNVTKGSRANAMHGLQEKVEHLNRERARLNGKLINYKNSNYRIKNLEYNSTDFGLSRNKKIAVTVMVARIVQLTKKLSLSSNEDIIEVEDIKEEMIISEETIKSNLARPQSDLWTPLAKSNRIISSNPLPEFISRFEYENLTREAKWIYDALERSSGPDDISKLCSTLDAINNELILTSALSQFGIAISENYISKYIRREKACLGAMIMSAIENSL